MRKRTQRLLSLLLAALLMLTVLPASAATASTVQLTKTTGTVSVTNASRRTISKWSGMSLYNGYSVHTRAGSYAWLTLDRARLSKLDVNSIVEMRKSGTKLQLLLRAGHIYFNVSNSLGSGESLNIRTSTMSVGIRGTCGWVKEIDEYTSELYLLEGTVECAGADPASGELKTTTVKAGEKVIVTIRPQAQEGERCEITREKFSAQDIDDFVMEELAEDPDLCEDIYKDSGLDVLGTHEGEDQQFGPTGELVDSGSAGDNVTWAYYSDGTLAFSGTGNMDNYDLWLNEEDNTTPWSNYLEQIKTVIISEGVTSVGSWAFYQCRNLTSVAIPDSVDHIYAGAFESCGSLTSVTIPDSVGTIFQRTFAGCSSLTDVKLPGSLLTIGERAFYYCSSLTGVIIPDRTSRINPEAFFSCTSLSNVTIPASVTYIGADAFYGCSSLTDVYYGGSATQWAAIDFVTGNGLLTSARLHTGS